MLARTQTFMVENFPGKKKKEREKKNRVGPETGP